MIANFPNPPKDNEKGKKQVRFNKKVNHAYDNGENNIDQNIYAYMACMSSNDEYSSENYGDGSQLINWIWDLGATFHMTLEVSDFISGSLQDTDKYIEVADGHHVTSKQKGQVQIKMCNNNGKSFIATLHNVLLAPDLCDRLFLIITLMNEGHTCLFAKGFAPYTSQQKRIIQ